MTNSLPVPEEHTASVSMPFEEWDEKFKCEVLLPEGTAHAWQTLATLPLRNGVTRPDASTFEKICRKAIYLGWQRWYPNSAMQRITPPSEYNPLMHIMPKALEERDVMLDRLKA